VYCDDGNVLCEANIRYAAHCPIFFGDEKCVPPCHVNTCEIYYIEAQDCKFWVCSPVARAVAPWVIVGVLALIMAALTGFGITVWRHLRRRNRAGTN